MRTGRLLVSLLFILGALAACGTAETGSTGGAAAPTAASEGGASAAPTTMTEGAASEAATAVSSEAPTVASTGAETAQAGSGESSAAGSGDNSLAAVKERGKLVVGVKYDVPLFGFLNPTTNKVEGFDVDMAKLVAERIFGDPEAVEFKEAVSKNRIPYLEEGVVDVVFSTMTANEERAQQIDFSDTYYVAGQSLLVPVDSDITGIETLGGKVVGTVKGSTSEKNIREKAPDAQVELFDTYSEAVQAMQSGRVDAVTTDDIILYGFQKNNPDRFKVVGGQFTQEPYAAGIKKGNTELLNEVNAAIQQAKEDGTWAELYKQWISEDVPEVPPQDWRDIGT